MGEPFSETLLRKLVTAHLPVDGNALRFQSIRTGKHNRSYYVHAGEDEMVLRICPPPDLGMLFYERNMMAQEPAIHALLRAKTTVPVAEIYAYDDSHTRIDRSYMLMERLPGRALSEMPNVTKRFYDRVLVQTEIHRHSLVAAQRSRRRTPIPRV